MLVLLCCCAAATAAAAAACHGSIGALLAILEPAVQDVAASIILYVAVATEQASHCSIVPGTCSCAPPGRGGSSHPVLPLGGIIPPVLACCCDELDALLRCLALAEPQCAGECSRHPLRKATSRKGGQLQCSLKTLSAAHCGCVLHRSVQQLPVAVLFDVFDMILWARAAVSKVMRLASYM